MVQLSMINQQRHGWIKSSDRVYTIRGVYQMPAANTGLAKARRVFTKHDGVLRTSNASRLGIYPRTFAALKALAEIAQAGREVYRDSPAPPLSSPDLVPIAHRIPSQ